ncbi:N-acetyltransferase [Asanoa ishikariensis]|uniref:N-acetylglutamate synthase, GNAT family n=1 Tax=Asanoa ishikariensis TaxID=137265 RepID=A0A1H3TYM5_9ACTN|nr:GNAT family N-acetyltransferase [Asanoa ishikariensis]GIF67650.1 N-acetyltransferase [Asanoa ishikariensis]SDZ54881.1 N-acetylglutamate synthase, GNAT family [Asanoa ishikariensis]
MRVRRATVADAAALAGLRWRRVTEEGDYTGTDRADFLESFADWLAEHQASHLPFLAEDGERAVGMAWLMVAERVPTPRSRSRRSGDVQSVYVVPELRDGGVGAVLLAAVLAEARTLDLEHVTVHSSDRAVPFYQRVGFAHDRTLLYWKP